MKYQSNSKFTIVIIFSLYMGFLFGQKQANDKVIYLPKQYEKVIKEMKKEDEQYKEKIATATELIQNRQKALADSINKDKMELRLKFDKIIKPNSPKDFQSVYHYKPVRQYDTWACWSFSTTSYFESELYRIHNKKIKLSEMYTVYFDFIEKARRFVKERGKSFFDGGSEGNSVIIIWKKYGIVPLDAYHGVLSSDGRYDTSEMRDEMISYIQYVEENDIWDEELVVSSISLIMDKYIGKPPQEFEYMGKIITPLEFLKEYVNINLDDYVCIMSTMSKPFYKYGEYETEANWWYSNDYYNLPLNEFYDVVKHSIQRNYSVKLNGDVSEPGYYGKEDSAIIPTFDIPLEFINQSSREFRFANGTTSDDHDLHLVGYTKIGEHDWYLIKDSGSYGYMGNHYGYLFFREDYIKLKILTCIVHKDILKAIVEQFH